MLKGPAALLFLAAALSASLAFAEAQVKDEAPPPAPSAPQARIEVEVKDDLLRVDLMDAEFGSVMRAIAAKTGIKVELEGDVGKRRLTTRFAGLELERGIGRLMTLIKEKNYTIRYDTKGRVSVVEVYGSEQPAAPAAGTAGRSEMPKQAPQPAMPSAMPAVQKNPPLQRRLIPAPKPVSPRAEAPARPVRNGEKQDPDDSDYEDEMAEELPYIPPQRRAPSATR